MQELQRQAEAKLDNYTGVSSESRYDDEGFDDEGFDDEGYDDEGFDDEGFDDDNFDGEEFFVVPQSRRVAIGPNDRSVKVIINNATGGASVDTVKLFGSYSNPASAIPAGITIEMPLVNGGYAAFLEQIKTDTAKVQGLRLKYSNAVNSSYPIKTKNYTGYSGSSEQIILPDDYIDNYAQNEKIINVPNFSFTLSGNDLMEVQVPDGSTMELTLYVVARNDQANAVRAGVKTVETLKKPAPKKKGLVKRIFKRKK